MNLIYFFVKQSKCPCMISAPNLGNLQSVIIDQNYVCSLNQSEHLVEAISGRVVVSSGK